MNITTNKLTIGYDTHVVQRNINISLNRGEMVTLLGPNGCGKTTLLRTMAGLQAPINGLIEPELNQNNMAMVLTERVSLDGTLAYDVVAMGRYPYTSFLGILNDEDREIIRYAFSCVGLPDEIENRMFNSLSDGEKQRVLIAKAIAQRTHLILLDEPTAHLDLPNRIRLFHLLRNLAHEHDRTILMSTHELDLALAFSDRAFLMGSSGVTVIDEPQHAKEDAAIRQAFLMAYRMDVFDY